MKKVLVYTIIYFLFALITKAQDTLIQEEIVYKEPFRSYRIINGQSVETIWKGHLLMTFSHKFWGKINGGVKELFGLDQYADMRIGLGYGITDNVAVELGRSRTEKIYDGSVKYRFLRQEEGGLPLTMTILGSVAVKSRDWNETEKEALEFKHRLSYMGQLLIASEVLPALSLHVTPTLIHRNLAVEIQDENTTFLLGMAAKVKLSEKMALVTEYYPRLGVKDIQGTPTFDVIGLGLNITTAKHAYLLHFTNNYLNTEQEALTRNRNDFFDKGIYFGFHISRMLSL